MVNNNNNRKWGGPAPDLPGPAGRDGPPAAPHGRPVRLQAGGADLRRRVRRPDGGPGCPGLVWADSTALASSQPLLAVLVRQTASLGRVSTVCQQGRAAHLLGPPPH